MSEHNIEELERQLKAAEDRERQANLDVRAARGRLQNARNETSGIVGHVLEFNRKRGWGSKATQITKRILVDTVKPSYNGQLYAYGKVIVASGAIGVRRDDVLVTEANDLGPHKP